MSVRSRRASRSLAVAGTIAACFAAAAIPATPALGEDIRASRQPKTVHVTGLLTLTDAKKGEFDVTGDLVGKWTIPPTQAVDYYNNQKTTFINRGTESFTGCLVVAKRPCGTLNSDYISWTYQKPSGRLISGGCVHAPTGGTEGFRGVRGLIVMTDTPVGKNVNTLYQGEVILNAYPKEKPMPIPRVPVSAAAVTATAGSC